MAATRRETVEGLQPRLASAARNRATVVGEAGRVARPLPSAQAVKVAQSAA